jgi:hypothetical protein
MLFLSHTTMHGSMNIKQCVYLHHTVTSVLNGTGGTLLTPELCSAGIRFVGIAKTRGDTVHRFGIYCPRGGLVSHSGCVEGSSPV